MSQPKPSQIWEALFPNAETNDIQIRPVVVLSVPSSRQNCLVTPLLHSNPNEPKSIVIAKDQFLKKKPQSDCYVNPYSVYPMDISLFTNHVADLDAREYEKIKSAVLNLFGTD